MRLDDFVGREAEARVLLANATNKRNTLIVGDAGIGKSALLTVIDPALEEMGIVINITRHAPFGNFLKEVYSGLWDKRLIGKTHEASSEESPNLQEDLRSWGKTYPTNPEKAKNLIHEIARVSESQVVYIVVDDASGVTPTSRPWLEQLAESAVILAAADPKVLKTHKRYWKTFTEEIRLEPLSRQETETLTLQLVEHYNVTADEPEVYKRRLVELSGGSPSEIYRLVKYHSAASLVRTRDMGHMSQSFVERDEKGVAIAPVLLLFAAWGIALRYIARAQGDLDLYVIGGISIAVMIVFSPFLRSALKPRSSN